MKHLAPVNKIAQKSLWLVAAILVLLPFHAFLTVWLSSLAGHYTLLRLWKEALLVPIVFGAIYILAKDRSSRNKFLSLSAVRLIFAYLLLVLICAFAATSQHAVSSMAMWYGVLVDSRFLIFFLAVLVLAAKSDWIEQRWQKILLLPAVFVAAFAILQYLVLPTDFLRHFGYSNSTISPYETINHNVHNLRVASTLRGANPLGAYLIIPICAIAAGLFGREKGRRDQVTLAVGFGAALIFSFSRSAWIGALLGVLTIGWLTVRSAKLKRSLSIALASLIALAVLVTLVFHSNNTFQHVVLHTDQTSHGVTSSNEGHLSAFKLSAKDVIRHPLGGGVGTAGPQSVYNNHPARIAENYFLQIGQETGLLGLALFIAICVVIGRLLLAQKSQPLALILFASLIGITFVNLLSHAWADDTLAYIWWGFAGLAIASRYLGDGQSPTRR